MKQKFAFLLISLILVSTISFAVPTAELNASPTSGDAPLNVTFSGDCQDDNGATPIVSCTIDLDEGNPAVELNSLGGSHTFTAAGTYDLNLHAENSEGASAEEITRITVNAPANNPPTVSLDVSPNSGTAPLEVAFTGSCSDADGDLMACRIDLYWDGTEGDTNGGVYGIDFNKLPEKKHTYYEAGQYFSRLTAIDAQGNKSNPNNGKEYVNVDSPSGSAPAVSNKLPADGTSTGEERPAISFDVNDSDSDADSSTLHLFVNGSEAQLPTISPAGNGFHVSWEFGEDQGHGTVEVGLTVEDTQGNSTGDVNWDFLIDLEAPTFDDISIAEYTNDETPTIEIEGVSGSPAEMALSCNNSSWKSWQNYSSSVTNFDITSSSYGCLDGSQGSVTVYLKLRDAVGNVSSVESDSTVFDEDAPSAPDLHTAEAGNEEVYLDWTSSSDNESGVKEYLVYRNGTHIKTTTATDCTVENLDNGEEYDFKLRARDRSGNTSGYSNTMEATPSSTGYSNQDNTAPYLYWELPDDEDTVSGTITLKVWAYDDESNIKFVKFYVDGENVGTDNTAISERYSLQWDSSSVADGEHELKAIAKTWSGDEEHNSRFKTIDVRTDNGVEEDDGTEEETSQPDGNRQLAREAINRADDEKESVGSLLLELQQLGISPNDEVMEEFASADEKLQDAMQKQDLEEYGESLGLAEEAEEMFSDVKSMISIEEYGSESAYVYNKEHLGILLQGIGLNQGLSQEAEENMQDCEIKRTLEIKRVRNGNSTEFRASVSILVKNESGQPKEFKVVEVIPKLFVGRASSIVPNGFSVIDDDPVLSWQLSLGQGEEKQISYTLKDSMTLEKADEMLESNALNKFKVPPILMNAEAQVTKQSFSGSQAGLFSLGNGLAIAGWIILIIVVAGAALYAWSHLSQREPGPSSGLGAVSGGTSQGFLSRLGSDSKKEKKQEGGKWAYRE